MSVASELTNLAANRDAIKAAIEAKSPATAPTAALSSFPASIASIPSGGGGAWTKPSSWPDIRPILEADTHQYANKLIALLDADASMPSIALTGGTYYVLSDGYEGGATTHVWDTSKDIVGTDGRRYHWGIVMSDSELTNLGPCSGTSYDTKVLWSYGPDADVTFTGSYPNYRMMFCESVTVGDVSQTSGNRIFSDMYSLRSLKAKSITVVSMQQAFANNRNLAEIDVGTFDTASCTSFLSAFSGCWSLVESPSFDSSSATTMEGAFANCASLKLIPHLDASSCTNIGSIFQACDSLEGLPSDFSPSDGCAKTRIYQGCRCLRKPLSRFVADSGAVVVFYEANMLDSMGDYVDLRAVTNFSSMFGANSFVKVPTTLLVSQSLNISSTFFCDNFSHKYLIDILL